MNDRLLALTDGVRLTPVQRRIAQCLLERPGTAAFLSSNELATLAEVSQPSVTRFAMALGFDGYPSLRRALRADGAGDGAALGTGAGAGAAGGGGGDGLRAAPRGESDKPAPLAARRPRGSAGPGRGARGGERPRSTPPPA